MKPSLLLLWILTGWCANVPRYRIPRRRIPVPPEPDPPPRPNWIVPTIIGVVAGVIGGWVFVEVFGPYPEPWREAGPFPEPWARAVFAAASAVGAFVLGRVATDIYEQLSNRGR